MVSVATARRTASSADRMRRHRRRLSNGKVVVPVEIDDVAVPLALVAAGFLAVDEVIE
jgi:hypothetical protein